MIVENMNHDGVPSLFSISNIRIWEKEACVCYLMVYLIHIIHFVLPLANKEDSR